MKSKIEGRNYVVLPDGERFPLKLNRKRTDKVLFETKIALERIQVLMKSLYSYDYDLYSFFVKEVYRYSNFNFDEGQDWNLDMLVEALNDIHERLLVSSDEIKPAEEMELLEDLGYVRVSFSKNHVIYEKIMEDTSEKEVTEEIQFVDGKMFRRIRTVYWDCGSGYKSSKKITYKKIGKTKRLMNALMNSLKNDCNQ